MSHRLDEGFVLDPRLAADCHLIGDFKLTRALLMNDVRFPWLVLVPRRKGMRELIDLSRSEQHLLLEEVDRCANVLQTIDHPHKLNIAALGNVVEQLHVHVIARFTQDAAWPKPVWNIGQPVAYNADMLNVRLIRLRGALGFDHN